MEILLGQKYIRGPLKRNFEFSDNVIHLRTT
jgi:hypothetical protein